MYVSYFTLQEVRKSFCIFVIWVVRENIFQISDFHNFHTQHNGQKPAAKSVKIRAILKCTENNSNIIWTCFLQSIFVYYILKIDTHVLVFCLSKISFQIELQLMSIGATKYYTHTMENVLTCLGIAHCGKEEPLHNIKKSEEDICVQQCRNSDQSDQTILYFRLPWIRNTNTKYGCIGVGRSNTG